MRLSSWLLLFLLVLVQGILTTLPLTLIFFLCLTVVKRREWIFTAAFIVGLLLDYFALRSLGMSSLYLVTFLFLVLLYQRKYETATLPFVTIATFLGSYFYLFFLLQDYVLIQAVLCTVIAMFFFSRYRLRLRPVHEGFQRV